MIGLTGSPGAMTDVVVLTLKVTAIVAGGALAAVLARRRPAATRHFVWLATLASVLALTALTPVAPRIALRVPAMAKPEPEDPRTPAQSMESRAALPPARASAPQMIRDATAGVRDRTSSARSMSAAQGLAIVWFGGCAAVLLWCLIGHLGLARLRRGAVGLDLDAWRGLIRHARLERQFDRGGSLGFSSAVGTPLTWGWPRAVILLPRDAGAWPAERQRAALLHELAHVARGDYLAQLVATLACAIYWFHPLVWMAASRLRSESEHACDDAVLADGTPAPEYASTLLDVARRARAWRIAGSAAVGMARRSHLEGRLLAVLDDSRPRGAVSRRAAGAAIGLLALTLVPFAGLVARQVAAAAPPAADSAEPEASVKVFPATATSPTVTSPTAAPPTAASPTAPSPAAASPTAASATAASPTAASPTATSATAASPTAASPAAESPAPSPRSSDAAAASTFQRSISARSGETLRLELRTGGSVVIEGWDRPTVDVHATLAGRNWRDTRVEADQEPSGVMVRSTQVGDHESFSTSHVFEIRVPRRCDVQINSTGGDITIVGVEGTFRGLTGGGEIVLERDKGRVRLTTGGGDVYVTDSELDGSVITGGGLVRISNVKGDLHGSSGSGPVIRSDGAEEGSSGDLSGVMVDVTGKHIGIAPDADPGRLRIRKAGGDVDLKQAPQGADITTGGGDIRVGPGAGTVEATTGGGDIEIGPIAGSVYSQTGAGATRVSISDARGKRQDVRVSSGSGGVILELPASLDARIELETAYTQSFGRASGIDSDWKLERTSTTNWDDSQGTPRRYVRARGEVGSGRGLIKVSTVNGDIEVRRRGN